MKHKEHHDLPVIEGMVYSTVIKYNAIFFHYTGGRYKQMFKVNLN